MCIVQSYFELGVILKYSLFCWSVYMCELYLILHELFKCDLIIVLREETGERDRQREAVGGPP